MINNIILENIDENEKLRFKQLLSEKFNDNLKGLNDSLDKYIQSKNTEKNLTKKHISNIKKMMNLKKKKKQYDKQYYQEHKDKLLKDRKERYNNDNEFKEHMKLKHKKHYSQ